MKMLKNKLLGLILGFVVMIALLPANATIVNAATPYPVWIFGAQITSDNMSDVLGDGGTVSYDPEAGILYLKNAEIGQVTDRESLSVDSELTGIYTTADLTIDITGDNTVKTSYMGSSSLVDNACGIISLASLTIQETGKLQVMALNKVTAGIRTKKLIINSGEVAVGCLSGSQKPYALETTNDITINGGFLDLYSIGLAYGGSGNKFIFPSDYSIYASNEADQESLVETTADYVQNNQSSIKCIRVTSGTKHAITVTGGKALDADHNVIDEAVANNTITLQADAAPAGKDFDKWDVTGATVEDANSMTTTFTMSYSDVTATVVYKDHVHNYVTSIIPATLTTNGKITKICSGCGDAMPEKIIYAVSDISLAGDNVNFYDGSANCIYDGTEKNPTVVVKDLNGDIVSSDNYIVSMGAGRTGIGTYNIAVQMTGEYYEGSKVLSFNIRPARVANITTTNTAKGVKISWDKVKGATQYNLYRSSDLGVTYKRIAIVAKNSYTDTGAAANGKTYYYKVLSIAAIDGAEYKGKLTSAKTDYFLSRPAISSLKSSAKTKALAKWKKNTKAAGYQIQYSLTSKFTSGNKTVTIKGNSTVSKTLTKLKSGKKYYVRIRSYKKVSYTTYYSDWSAAKYVKVK